VNPVKIRNGTATVSAEIVHKTKVGHWDIPEKAVHRSGKRKSGDLLEQNLPRLQVRAVAAIVVEKRLQHPIAGCCSFCFTSKQMNIFDVVRRFGEKPKQPSIAVFGLCHKSETLPHRSGLPRFDRRVQPNLSVLEDRLVALFCFVEATEKPKEG